MAIHLSIRSRADLQNVKKGERFNGIHSPCWEKSTSTRLALASIFQRHLHFIFLTVRVSILVELATTQAALINMHPDDCLFPQIASVLQTSVAVGGPNTCNLAAGQILAQHPLAMNYLEMASVPQIHLCFVLGFFFSQCNQN